MVYGVQSRREEKKGMKMGGCEASRGVRLGGGGRGKKKKGNKIRISDQKRTEVPPRSDDYEGGEEVQRVKRETILMVGHLNKMT